MGGRGSSSGGGGSISASRKEQIISGIKNHTEAQNDRAEQGYLTNIEKEKQIVENLQSYIRVGYIKSKSDPWYQGHLDTYNSLNAQLKFFRSQRKKLGK